MKKPLHTLRSPAIYLCILTTVFLVVMAAENAGFTRKNASLSQVFHLSTQDQLIDCSSDWTFKDGTPAQLNQLAVQTHGRNEPMAVIYTTIPIVSQQSNYLLFSSINAYFTVSVEGRIIYNYSYTPYKTAGKSYGQDYHSIPLEREWEGKQIVISASFPYQSSGCFTNIAFGSAGRYYYQVIHQSLPAFLNSLAIIIYGALLLMLSLTMKLNTTGSLNTSIRGFSLFSILYGIWALEECSGGQLFIGGTIIWRVLGYLALILIPYPLATAVENMRPHPSRKTANLFGWISLADFIVIQLLWNVFGYDVHDCSPLIMSILIASFVHFIYVSVKDLPSEPKFLERYIWMIIGLAIFMGTGFVDYFRYNIMGIRFQDTAAFSRTGYIFLMILLTIQYVNEIKWRLTTSMKAEIYRHQAYTDPLTGLGNRTSWRTSHDSLVAQMKEGNLKKVLVVSIDLNHLKMINDEKGHIEGDRYILNAASLLRDVFSPGGLIFRTGGDEFIIYLINERDYSRWNLLENKLRKEAERRSISLSWGIAIASMTGEDLDQAFARADENMYTMKKELHAERRP